MIARVDDFLAFVNFGNAENTWDPQGRAKAIIKAGRVRAQSRQRGRRPDGTAAGGWQELPVTGRCAAAERHRPITINLFDASNGLLEIFWIDLTGERKTRHTLHPNTNVDQRTHVTRPGSPSLRKAIAGAA